MYTGCDEWWSEMHLFQGIKPADWLILPFKLVVVAQTDWWLLFLSGGRPRPTLDPEYRMFCMRSHLVIINRASTLYQTV